MGSSAVAATVVGLVQGATRSLVVDMGILLEGHAREELPEALLGTARAPPQPGCPAADLPLCVAAARQRRPAPCSLLYVMVQAFHGVACGASACWAFACWAFACWLLTTHNSGCP